MDGRNKIDKKRRKKEKEKMITEKEIEKTLETYSKLLDRVTNGRMSKTNYTWEAICEVLDEIEEKKREAREKLI